VRFIALKPRVHEDAPFFSLFFSCTLTAGMVAMLWLAWQSTHYAREPMSFPRVGRFIPVTPFTTLEKIRTALSIGRAK
jgi:hypothetical protein